MAKITEYPAYSQWSPTDLLLVVSNVNTDPANKKLTIGSLFGNLTANVSVTGTFTVNGAVTVSGNTYTISSTNTYIQTLNAHTVKVTSNGIIIEDSHTPANSSINEAGSAGKISWDENYLYVKTANNNIKRVSLQSF